MLYNKMVIKTFNIDEEIYKTFSEHCKKNGISMSKRVENFLKEEVSKIKFKTQDRSNKKEIGKPTMNQNNHTFSKYC